MLRDDGSDEVGHVLVICDTRRPVQATPVLCRQSQSYPVFKSQCMRLLYTFYLSFFEV
jgi:hypothetical protein